MTFEEITTAAKAKIESAKAFAAQKSGEAVEWAKKHQKVTAAAIVVTGYIAGKRIGTEKGVRSITDNYALLTLYDTTDGPEVGLYVSNDNPGQDKYAEALDRFAARGSKWVDCEKVPVRKGQKM